MGIFYILYPSQGIVRGNKLLVSISFSFTIGMVVHNAIAIFVVSKCECYALL